MHILIAGGTGVLGRRIVPALLGQGHRVTVLARRPERAEALRRRGAAVAAGDVFDRVRTMRAIAEAAPDVVMHQLTDLANGSTAANAALRLTGTRNLVDGALAAGVQRFIVQSIAWAYAAGPGPADEATPLDTRSTEEGRRRSVDAVIAMERAVREVPEWVALRNGMLYGPDTWYWTGGLVARSAQAGKLPATADVTSFVHVDDAAAASVAALTWPTGAVNVVDDEPAAGAEWVPVFCRALLPPAPGPSDGAENPRPAVLLPAPGPSDGPAAVSARTDWARGATNEYAREKLGWTPAWPSWRAGFAAMQSPAAAT
jgi:nucleoside-diphosphate-sugar epimerase